MKPGDEVTVHKRNEHGVEVWTYPGRIRDATPTSVTLEARFNGPDGDFHGLSLRHGDRFVETFFTDRGYNVFTVFDSEGLRFKGWYVNIARPAEVQDGHLHADDLALDLIVLPDGTIVVVDEDEFARLEISDQERGAALATLEALKERARTRQEPFRPAQAD